MHESLKHFLMYASMVALVGATACSTMEASYGSEDGDSSSYHASNDDILKTNGFSDCSNNSTITVNNVDIQFDRSTNLLTFDVSGSSAKSQQVIAALTVTAYGVQVYQNSFDPCDASTKVVTQMLDGSR